MKQMIFLTMELTIMHNVLITGGDGQLGSELREEISNLSLKDSNFYFTDKDDLDITDESNLRNFVTTNKIDTIINCAAYTAVDKAEEDVEIANKINHLAVKYLAQVSKDKGIKLVHVSTDYVFDGTNHKPYVEDDITNPNSVYGETKLAAEKVMMEINPENSVILRTSWVYSSYGANFVKTMLRLGEERDNLGVIFDQVGTPTYAKDLAKTILEIIPKLDNKNVNLYHYSNEGVCSWYDFAQAIFELSAIQCQVNPIETKEYPTPAKRPHYSLLNKSKIKKDFNLTIPYWKQSLVGCLKVIQEQ